MTSKYKYAIPAPRQVGGDDGFCYVVYVNGREKLNGLTRREASYYREKFEKEEREKHEKAN
jgi:hypothetical protein